MGRMGNAIRAVPSHHIPWDISHGNPIPMDKPGASSGDVKHATRQTVTLNLENSRC